jgi:hypothetical protein
MIELSLFRRMGRSEMIKSHHGRFAENAFRTVWIFFGHIKNRSAVLRAMTARATKMDIRNHGVSPNVTT